MLTKRVLENGSGVEKGGIATPRRTALRRPLLSGVEPEIAPRCATQRQSPYRPKLERPTRSPSVDDVTEPKSMNRIDEVQWNWVGVLSGFGA